MPYQYQHRIYRPDGTFWVSEFRDDTTRTVTTYDEAGAVTSTRPYTADENTAADETAARAAVAATYQALTDATTLDARLDRLAAYKTDTDLTAVLGQTNNQALQTATLNRALKTMIRREERLSATLALLVRLLDPALLASITDTTDA